MKTDCKHRSSPFRAASLIAASAAVLFLACSGAEGSDETTLWDVEATDQESTSPQAPLSSEEREAEFQQKFVTPLGEEERLAVEQALVASGEDADTLRFVGRMVVFGDVYLEADTILGQLREQEADVPKGRTLKSILASSGTDNLKSAPTVYSTVANGNYLFHRPDISGMRIIVPNNATFLITPLQQAVANVTSAADDCLTSITVQTQSQYDALADVEKVTIKPIFVRYGAQSTVCPTGDSGTIACGLFPRDETREFEVGLSSTRMIPGPRLGINNALVTSANASTRVGSLTHEILHNLGLAHPDNSGASGAVVAGSSCAASVLSIMRSNGGNGVIENDDRKTIDALYSPVPGGSCFYSRSLKVIGPAVTPC